MWRLHSSFLVQTIMVETHEEHNASGPVAYALLKNAQSRVISQVAPRLAAFYARQFTDVLPSATRGDESHHGRSAQVLWGEPTAPTAPKKPASVFSSLPGWFFMTNPLCQHCATPLIPGRTATHVHNFRHSRGSRKGQRKFTKRMVLLCETCMQLQPAPAKPISARQFSTVRSRNKHRKLILEGQWSQQMSSHNAKDPMDLLGKPNHTSVAGESELSLRKQRTSLDDVFSLKQYKADKYSHQSNKSTLPSKNSGVTDNQRKVSSLTQPEPIHADPRLSRNLTLGHSASPRGHVVPKEKKEDVKAGLRALLQKKKEQKKEPAKPTGSGGLADFLSQL